ncbi:putative FBD-associated F-box protein [Arabidopsis thaliana]
MDIFNGLPDDVLVKILSFVPTKVAVSTSILSKRWEFLWMWLPRLDFGSPKTDLLAFLNTCQYDKEEEVGLVDFIDKKLPLHRAPFLAMYVCWKFLMNVGMKTYFHVRHLETRQQGKSLQDILSICPVLDDLSVICSVHQDVKEFTIIVPSLQSLTLFIENCEVFDGYVIDTPSLKYLKLEDVHEEEHYCLLKKMPKLREAYVDVQLDDLKSLIGSITSDSYDDGFVFNQLEHLNLCVCMPEKSKILGQLLKDSPNLRVLNIFKVQSLQIFNLSHYFGKQQDLDFVVYILKNACHLKTATILADEPEHLVPNLKELTLSPRASSTCQLSIRCGLGSERS